MSLVLAGLIKNAIKRDQFLGAIVYGPQRTGKSSYSAKVMYEVYGDWDMVNKMMLFRLEDVVEVIERATTTGVKVPVFCWDDCGVHGNNLLYFANRDLVMYLGDLLDVAGISVGSILMTTPSPEKLLKVVRGYEFLRVKVTNRDGSTGRRSVGYNSTLLPSGTRIIHRLYEDSFSVTLPDAYWRDYMVKRKGYLVDGLKRLRGAMKRPIQRDDGLEVS